MLFESYKINNILQNKGSVSIYKGIHLPTSSNVVLFEFKKNINLVKNLDDVYLKILLAHKITNPLEIMDIFKDKDKLYIVLPENYLQVDFPFTGLLKNKETTDFLNNDNLKVKYLYLYGNEQLRKSFMLVVIRIYLVIKDYFTFYFKPAFKTNIDEAFLKYFLSIFNFDISDKTFLNNMKSSIYIEQNFLSIVHKIEKQINKKKIAILIDNINNLSNPLKNLLYSLSNYFSYTFPDNNLIIVLNSDRKIIHPLIKRIKKTYFFDIYFSEITYDLLKDSLKKTNNDKFLKLLDVCNNVSQFYFLFFLNKSNIINNIEIKSNNFFHFLQIFLSKLSNKEIEIIKLIYLIDHPLNPDLISFLTKIDINDIKKYLDNLIKNIILLRIHTTEGIFFTKFFKINTKKFLNLLNSFSSDSLINGKNIENEKKIIYEKIGDYFLNFHTNIEKSLYFYILSKNKKKSLLLSINLINLYNDIKLYENSNNIIDMLMNNFELDKNEKTILLNEKIKILYLWGNLGRLAKTAKEALKTIPFNKKMYREEVYFYQALGYIYSINLKKSRNIFKYLIKTSTNYKIIFSSKFYLLEIDFFMGKNENFEERIQKLKKEILSFNNINNEVKQSLITDIHILKAKYYISLDKLNYSKLELNKLFINNNEVDLKNKIIHNNLYALILLTEGKYTDAILLVSETLPLIEDVKEHKLYSDIINIMGLIFYNSKIYLSANIFFEKALKIKAQIHDKINSINILIRLSEINILVNRLKKAKAFILKALKISKKIEHIQKTLRCTAIYNHIIVNQNSTHLGVR